jgi:hypothetical protein
MKKKKKESRVHTTICCDFNWNIIIIKNIWDEVSEQIYSVISSLFNKKKIIKIHNLSKVELKKTHTHITKKIDQ